MAMQMEMQMEMQTEVQAEPRAAVAAQPHERRAVLAATAVEEAGSQAEPAGGEDTWTTVSSRRARRQERARRLAPYARAAEPRAMVV
eukprot:4119941-Prymnesium_polylepis.1